MRRNHTLLIILLATGVNTAPVRAQSRPSKPAAQQPNTLTAKERAAGWRLLFDGKTLTGWRGYQMDSMPSGWRVVDGALTRVATAGDIITREQFDNNWELVVDWKTEKGGNSGIFFDVIEAPGLNAIYESGPEFQILDNEAFLDVMTPETMTGANYALHRPSKDMRKPLGEWNHARLIVNGNHVEHWLNGVKLLEYEMGSDDWNRRVAASKFKDMPKYGSVRRGYIGLQEHGAMVAFRNIKLRTLKNAARSNSAPQNAAPQNSAPQNAAPGNSAPKTPEAGK
jgi:hypothetical protein